MKSGHENDKNVTSSIKCYILSFHAHPVPYRKFYMHQEHLYFCGEKKFERGPTKAYCVTLFMKCYIFIIFWAPFHPNSQVINNISHYNAELTFNRKKLLIENLNWCMILTHYIFVVQFYHTTKTVHDQSIIFMFISLKIWEKKLL